MDVQSNLCIVTACRPRESTVIMKVVSLGRLISKDYVTVET